MNRSKLGLASVAMAALLAACNESPTSSRGDRLTPQEAQAIADGVTQSGSSASSGLRPELGQSDVIASPPTIITTDHDSSHPCPKGGRIAVSLDATFMMDAEARSYALDARGALTHQGCMFVQESVTLTVNGDPNLGYEAHAAVENGQPKGLWRSEAEGAFNWTASDGRSGRCVLNITDVTDFAAKKRTVEGEVCGHTIKQIVSWR